MEIKSSGLGGAVSDKIMKVARFHNAELTVEVNISELARNTLSAMSCLVDDFAIRNDLPHFQCSIGIPNFVTLEKNMIDYFNKYNADCVERFAKKETEAIADRIKRLSEELEMKRVWDHRDWNKFALEESKKTRI